MTRRYGVRRPSVYAWTRKALDTLEQALKPEKRGPKFKKAETRIKDETINDQKIEDSRVKRYHQRERETN
jgi:hypothetical protein